MARRRMLWINTVTPLAFVYSMYHYNSYVKAAEGPLSFAARFLALFLAYHFLRLGPRSKI